MQGRYPVKYSAKRATSKGLVTSRTSFSFQFSSVIPALRCCSFESTCCKLATYSFKSARNLHCHKRFWFFFRSLGWGFCRRFLLEIGTCSWCRRVLLWSVLLQASFVSRQLPALGSAGQRPLLFCEFYGLFV